MDYYICGEISAIQHSNNIIIKMIEFFLHRKHLLILLLKKLMSSRRYG